MPLLRLEIYQPHAHYRIPYSINRRFTYPIPPYSTIIGFLCNACGIKDQRMELYKTIKELKISIAGKFACKTTEYVWFRNLSKEKHIIYYQSEFIRHKNGQVGHIGGQIPVSIDVLEDVDLIIHLYHENINSVEKLKRKLENLKDRLQPVHLGRAEDWIVIRDLKILEENKDVSLRRVDGAYDYFFWIAESLLSVDKIKINWEEIEGNIYYLTTLSSVEGYESHHNHAGRKIYKRVKTKLNDGKIKNATTLFDMERKIPIFLGVMDAGK